MTMKKLDTRPRLRGALRIAGEFVFEVARMACWIVAGGLAGFVLSIGFMCAVVMVTTDWPGVPTDSIDPVTKGWSSLLTVGVLLMSAIGLAIGVVRLCRRADQLPLGRRGRARDLVQQALVVESDALPKTHVDAVRMYAMSPHSGVDLSCDLSAREGVFGTSAQWSYSELVAMMVASPIYVRAEQYQQWIRRVTELADEVVVERAVAGDRGVLSSSILIDDAARAARGVLARYEGAQVVDLLEVELSRAGYLSGDRVRELLTQHPVAVLDETVPVDDAPVSQDWEPAQDQAENQNTDAPQLPRFHGPTDGREPTLPR